MLEPTPGEVRSLLQKGLGFLLADMCVIACGSSFYSCADVGA